jgi:flagellar hook-associated protein 2
MAGLTLGGLASGIDTDAVITQLMALERAPQARLKLKETSLQARQSALTDVATRLRSLQTAVKDLSSITTWAETQSLDVSDATKVAGRRLSGSAPGAHTLNVTQLARAEQHSFTFAPGAGTLNVGGTPIDISADDDGQDVADKINASPGAPVYAVFVKDPQGVAANDRLVFTRKETGELTQLSITGPAWATSGAVTLGVDAKYTVDGGTEKSSHSNVVTAAVPGLELTLKAAGSTTITVGPPAPDPEAVKTKVQAFVDQYNSTIDFIRGKLAEKKVPNATTEADARKGVLSNDSQLTGILRDLRNMVADKLTGLGAGQITSFGDIGVSTGVASGGKSSADAIAGKLTLDTTKLTEALTNKRLDVKAFLTDRDEGIAAKLTGLLDPFARSDGAVDARAKQTGSEIDGIDDQIAAMEERLTAKSDRLRAQFAAMEAAMAQSQSQGSWLSAQLSSL